MPALAQGDGHSREAGALVLVVELADAFDLRAAVWVVAVLSLLSGAVVAARMDGRSYLRSTTPAGISPR